MIIVNATLIPKEDKKDEIINMADDIITENRTHKGNIAYNMVEDVENQQLKILEKWETKEALENHMQTDVFQDFGSNTKDLLQKEPKVGIYFAELLNDKSGKEKTEIKLIHYD